MSVLVDTNVLLRSLQPNHEQFHIATSAVIALREREVLYVSTQNLYEFWVVCTRPLASNGLEMSSATTVIEMQKMRPLFKLLQENLLTFHRWQTLVSTHDIKGKNSHDARLVATMLVHDVGKILTFNR